MPPEAAVVDASSPPVQTAPPTTEIHVTPASVADKGPSSPPPKKGTAMDRAFADLRKKAGMEEETPPVTTKKTPEAKPEETETETAETTTETHETTKTTEAEPAKGKKPSPWKLVDEHKAARLKAETELAELRKTMAPPEKVKEYQEKLTTYEKRAKELEDHIAFVDYQKSSEFQEKYQKPYDDAWARWMGELGELTVADANGQERPLQPQDLLELVNQPLQKARAEAEEKFGNFADDVMDARKEIRNLFDNQQKALSEAKKMGVERIKSFHEQFRAQQESLTKEITKTWQESNKQAVEDPTYGKYFKPVEGDEEGNTRLKKGYEMADKAFQVNPNTPGLSAEQRADVVRLHSAIRNRAAGFGRLAYQNAQLEAKIAELTAKLNQYKGAEPGATTEARTHEQAAGGGTAMQRAFSDLKKYAH
jgi:hypothetical protein